MTPAPLFPSGPASRSALAAGIGLVLLFSAGAGAETFRYDFEAAEGNSATFEIPIFVEHEGRLVIEASWSGPRILFLKLEGPGRPARSVRRSGPSPQILEHSVSDEEVSKRLPWTLTIRAARGRGPLQGSLSIRIPEPPPTGPPPLPEEPSPPRWEWAAPKEPPDGATASVRELFDRIERFRSRTVGRNGTFAPDGCGWQAGLLRELAAFRDGIASTGTSADPQAAEFFGALAAAVRKVEALRTSEDPLLGGPAPENPSRLRAWRALRAEQLRPLETELDLLAERSRRAPLEPSPRDAWPQRFVACLTACERFFGERAVAGEEAPNRALAEEQWDAFLAAAEALEAAAQARTGP